MIIKKNSPGNIAKRSAIVVLSFFAYIIISTLIIININEGNFASTPVYEEWFGKHFVMGHFGAVSGFVLLLLTLFILTKTGYLKNPVQVYIEQEKKEFKRKYNLSFDDSVPKSKRNIALAAAIFSTLLPAALPLIATHYFNVEDHTFAAIVGIVLMIIGFYKSIGYLMNKSQIHVDEMIKQVNTLHNNTNLASTSYGMETLVMSSGFEMSFTGTYVGRAVDIQYSTTGYHTGRTVKVNSKSTVKMQTPSQHELTLSEQDMKWKKYDYRSTDDGFAKRFKYKSPSGYYLGNEAKEIFIQYNINLFLCVNNGYLLFNVENPDVLPYYSIEGMILFLDYLILCANTIETHPN